MTEGSEETLYDLTEKSTILHVEGFEYAMRATHIMMLDAVKLPNVAELVKLCETFTELKNKHSRALCDLQELRDTHKNTSVFSHGDDTFEPGSQIWAEELKRIVDEELLNTNILIICDGPEPRLSEKTQNWMPPGTKAVNVGTLLLHGSQHMPWLKKSGRLKIKEELIRFGIPEAAFPDNMW